MAIQGTAHRDFMFGVGRKHRKGLSMVDSCETLNAKGKIGVKGSFTLSLNIVLCWRLLNFQMGRQKMQ